MTASDPHLPDTRRVQDPLDLAALAHPLRLAILEQLALHGTMTASDLAAALNQNASNCSWHLRRLARRDFVRQSAGGAGRRRPWEATSEKIAVLNDGSWEDLPSASERLTRMWLDNGLRAFYRARDALSSLDSGWPATVAVHQALAWVTSEELRAISVQFDALLEPYRARHAEASPREDRRACAVVFWTHPLVDEGSASSRDQLSFEDGPSERR